MSPALTAVARTFLAAILCDMTKRVDVIDDVLSVSATATAVCA